MNSPAYNRTLCIAKTLAHYGMNTLPYTAGETWESIVFEDESIEKPPKEAFEAKFNELLAALPMYKVRLERNKRLKDSDYTTVSDYNHPTPEIKQAWIDYRQALRDLPANTTDPLNVIWPTPPV